MHHTLAPPPSTSQAVDTSKYYADTTVQSARETARSAADTASGMARSAYEVSTHVSGTDL